MRLMISIPHIYPCVTINTSIPWVIDYFFDCSSPFCTYGLSETSVDTIEFSIVYHNKMYYIAIKDQLVKYPEHRFMLFLSQLPHLVFKPHDKFVLLHGGALSINKKGVLLLGKSMAGKTTITAFLTKHHFIYYTDDLIILDYSHGLVFPFPRPLHIRVDSLNLLSDIYDINIPFRETTYETFLKRYLYFPDAVAEKECSISAIFQLNRQDNKKASCVQYSQEEAINIILENIYSIATPASSIKAAYILSDRIPTYCLTYNNLGDAKEHISLIVS